MSIIIEHKGDFKNLKKFLKTPHAENIQKILNYYGIIGVNLLASTTPKDTGKTSESWVYNVIINKDSSELIFSNSNVTNQGTPIVILLQYGHGTKNGGYVTGLDFINPAVQPVFDNIAKNAWVEVVNS